MPVHIPASWRNTWWWPQRGWAIVILAIAAYWLLSATAFFTLVPAYIFWPAVSLVIGVTWLIRNRERLRRRRG